MQTYFGNAQQVPNGPQISQLVQPHQHRQHQVATSGQQAQQEDVNAVHGARVSGSASAAAALRSAHGFGNPNMRLVVFDFDKTIMKEHIWGKYRNAPIEAINFSDEDFANLARFRALISGIKQQGHVAAVASFGRHDVVDKGLRYALGDDHGIAIRTPSDFGQQDGSSALGDKNTQLAALAARFGVSANQIILIDDDEKNVVAAQRAGTQGLFAPDGLTRNHVKQVARDVGVYDKMTDAYQHPVLPVASQAPNPRTIPAEEVATLPHRLSRAQ